MVQATDEGRVAEIARTFGVNWPHLTAQVISFGIVCAMLYWLAYKPVLRMLDERRQQIALGLANTEKINAALAGIEAQRQSVMTDAQAQAAQFLAEARDVAKRLQEQESARRGRGRGTNRPPGARSGGPGARAHAGRSQAGGRPVGHADDGRGHRKGADPGRSPSARRGNRAAAGLALVVRVGGRHMKTARQAQREAKKLFRLCLVDGALDEGRVRQVVRHMVDAGRPGGLAPCRAFSGW